MTVQIDPEKTEIAVLQSFLGDVSRHTILEIGCGDGRLTWLYASQAARTDAIDPEDKRIDKAKADLPGELRDKVFFYQSNLEQFYEQDSSSRFDLALLSWSL